MSVFQRATKTQSKLRLALIAPSGHGKTYTALSIAKGLGDKIALVDTEHGSASKYSDEFDFDTVALDSFHPQQYINMIATAEEAGYDVLVIDSLSHAWTGKDGALELKDAAQARDRNKNGFAAWRDVTPLHNKLIDAIVGAKLHVIATMRAKTEYVQEKDERGNTRIRKIGLAPVQRDGMEYEFDVVGDLDEKHTLIVTKSRCRAVSDAVVPLPGAQLAATLKAWLSDGAPAPEPPAPAPTAPTNLVEAVRMQTENWSDEKKLELSLLVGGGAKTLAEKYPAGCSDVEALYQQLKAAKAEADAAKAAEFQAGLDAGEGQGGEPHRESRKVPDAKPSLVGESLLAAATPDDDAIADRLRAENIDPPARKARGRLTPTSPS